MRTAIVHYWLVNMRGGEKVVEALCGLLPEADIFTLFYEPERVSPAIRSRVAKTSFLNPLRRHYRWLLPLAPFALAHRIIVSPSARIKDVDAIALIQEILGSVPVPGGSVKPN